MRLGILGIDKVRIVSGYHFYVILTRKPHQFRVDPLLLLVGLTVAARHIGLVTLQLYIIVVTESLLPPSDTRVSLIKAARQYQPRNLAAQTSRADYQPLSMGSQSLLVGTRMAVESLCPCLRH